MTRWMRFSGICNLPGDFNKKYSAILDLSRVFDCFWSFSAYKSLLPGVLNRKLPSFFLNPFKNKGFQLDISTKKNVERVQLFKNALRFPKDIAETTINLLFYCNMRKVILLGLYATVLPLAGHSQTNTTQLPNGVIVHQAQGVEGTPETRQEEPARVRTMTDWTLPECIDALAHTEMKLNESSGEDRERYLIEKARLVQRINELKAGH